MSNNKQGSIMWLYEKMFVHRGIITIEEFEQSKAMHKKETIDFALHCMMPNMNPDKSTIEVVSDIYDEYFGGKQ